MLMFDYIKCPDRTFMVQYCSKNRKGTHEIKVQANSERDIKEHWHSIMDADKYVIKKIEEVA